MCSKVMVVEPKLRCEAGTLVDGGSCMQAAYKPADYICEGGYNLTGNQCYREEFRDIIAECADEYEEVDGQCRMVKELEPVYRCQHGYTYRDGACVSTKYAAAQVGCPANYTLQAGKMKGYKGLEQRVCARRKCKRHGGCQCRRYKNKKVGKRQVCVAVTESTPEYVCDGKMGHGQKSAYQTCSATQTVTRQKKAYCTTGVYQNGMCETYVPADAISSCAEGEIGSDGYCDYTREVQGKMMCPKNSYVKEGQCYTRVKIEGCKEGKCYEEQPVAGNVVCSKGGTPTDAGTCLVTYKQRPTYTCPDGYDSPSKGKCMKKEQTPAETTECEADETDTSEACTKEVDTSYAAYVICPDGSYLKGPSKGAEEVCVKHDQVAPVFVCAADYSGPNAQGHCFQETAVAVDVSCPKGGEMTDGKCMVEHTVAMQQSCESGYVIKAGQCVRTAVRAAQAECAEGELRQSQCYTESMIDATPYCEHGYTMGDDGQCSSKHTVAKVAEYPAGKAPPTHYKTYGHGHGHGGHHSRHGR